MRDFEAFYAAGTVANRGEDPYGRAIWNGERTIPGVDGSHDETLPFVGPSAGLPLWRALAHLPYDVAGRVWGAILALAMLIVVFGVLILADAPRRPSLALGAAAFCGGYGPLTSDVALGQVALVAAAGVIAALVALRSRAWPAASLAAACATLQPSLVVVLAACATDLRAVTAFALGAAIFFAATLANGGAAGFVDYVHLLSVHGAAEAATVIQITPAAISRGFGASPAAVEAVRYGTACVAIVLALLAMRRITDGAMRVGIACCALPFVLPFVHEHDFVVMILPAVYCAVRAGGTTLAFASVSATASAVDWLGLGQHPNSALQAIALATACALGFALLGRLQREALAGLVVPLMVAVAVTLAHAHPVPIWPDALPPHWQAPASASVSQVWALEQQAAGLGAIEPVWSALRALCLLSAASLGFATYLTARQMSTFIISSNGVCELGLKPIRSSL